MLYVTTRSNKETYTSYKTLTSERTSDGGSFVPFKMPLFTHEQVCALKELSFNQIVADILNAFFSSRLTVWDVDLCIGKNPFRLREMNYRVLLAELWHNPKGEYNYLSEKLYARISAEEVDADVPDWVRTAVRIAVLFALYGQLCAKELHQCGDALDIAVSGDSFEAPMACFYARQMGLPLNVILCSFDDDSAAWDLIHRGTFSTSAASASLRCGIEKLLCATLGDNGVSEFLSCCEKGRSYILNEETQCALSDGFYCTVAGKNRAGSAVNSIYRSNAYVMDPVTALCYGGLQDYRSATGRSAVTLMISEHSPVHYIGEIAKATGLPEQKLLEQIKV